MKKTFKNLQNLGRHFCLFDIHKTGRLMIYRFQDQTYMKKRTPALTVNGMEKLSLCRPVIINRINAFIEV